MKKPTKIERAKGPSPISRLRAVEERLAKLTFAIENFPLVGQKEPGPSGLGFDEVKVPHGVFTSRLSPSPSPDQKTILGRLEDINAQTTRYVERLERMNGRFFGEPVPSASTDAASPFGMPAMLTSIESNLGRINNLLEYLDSHF